MKLVQMRSSLKVTIPKEICEALTLKKGDEVRISLTDSEIRIKKAV